VLGVLWALLILGGTAALVRYVVQNLLVSSWHWWRHGRLPPRVLRRLHSQARRSVRLRQLLDDRNAILDQLGRRERARWTRTIDGAVRSAFDLEDRLTQVKAALGGVDLSGQEAAVARCAPEHRDEAERRYAAYRTQVQRMQALAERWEWQLQSVSLELRSIRLASVVKDGENWPPKALVDLEELTLEVGARAELELPSAPEAPRVSAAKPSS
jgi:hypothetical protein